MHGCIAGLHWMRASSNDTVSKLYSHSKEQRPFSTRRIPTLALDAASALERGAPMTARHWLEKVLYGAAHHFLIFSGLAHPFSCI